MMRKLMACLLCICFALLLFDNVFAQDRTQQRRGSRMPRWTPEVAIGDLVKDFELPFLEKGTFKLSEYKGRIVVIELGACS